MRRRPASLLSALWFAALFAVLPSAAQASMVDLFGYGARGIGMAGAVAATARGHEAVYYNPAAMAFDVAPEFALGFQYANFDLQVGGNRQSVRDAPATLIGFSLPLPFGGWLERRLTLANGFVVPTRSVLIADLPRPDQLQFPVLENRAQTVTLQVALGLRATDWLSLGVGFIALAELSGAVEVAPNATGRIGASVRDELLADYALVAGALVRPTDTFNIGLAWRGESVARFSLPISTDLGEGFPLPVPVLNIEGVAQYDPAQAVAEVAWTLDPRLTLAGGVTFKRWSQYPRPILYPAVPEDFPAQPEPGFDDTWVPRLGAEGHLTAGSFTLEPRLGYAFAPSPAPEQTGDTNHLDSDRHIIGAGFGIRWQNLRLDLNGQWQQLVTRSHTKSEADITLGDLQDNPGAPRVEHEGRVFVVGMELGVQL